MHGTGTKAMSFERHEADLNESLTLRAQLAYKCHVVESQIHHNYAAFVSLMYSIYSRKPS